MRVACGGDLQPGQWRISGDGETFTVEANQADLNLFLADLQQMTPGEILLRSLTNRLISVRYVNVELDRLLSRLGLDYSLVYSRDESGSDSLEGGWISVHDPSRSTPAFSFAKVPDAAGSAGSPAAPTARKFVAAQPGESAAPDVRPPGAASPPPKLDGQLSDWPSDTTWHTIGTFESTNPVDLAYAYASLCDGTNLTVAVDIRDDMKAATNNFQKLLADEDDNVGLTLPGFNNFTINRHHVLVNGPNGPQTASQQFVSQSDGSRAVIHDKPDGWIVEIMMPTCTNQYSIDVQDHDVDDTPTK